MIFHTQLVVFEVCIKIRKLPYEEKKLTEKSRMSYPENKFKFLWKFSAYFFKHILYVLIKINKNVCNMRKF